MKIGIVTLCRVRNYGACLQAYAMKQILESKGHEVRFVEAYDSEFARELLHNDLGKIRLWYIPYLTHKEIKYRIFFNNFPKLCLNRIDELECILLGSDSIWDENYGKLTTPSTFFGKLDHSNISSYAPSVGGAYDMSKYTEAQIEGLKNIKHITVRDETTARFVEEAIGGKAEIVVDPTLLINWKPILDVSVKNRSAKYGDYLLLYGGFDLEMIHAVKEYAAWSCLQVVNIGGFNWRFKNNPVVDPLEFADMIRHAKFVLTSMFHGVMMSIALDKDFRYIAIDSQRSIKIATTLKQLDLEECIVSKDDFLANPVESCRYDIKKEYQIKKNRVRESIEELGKCISDEGFANRRALQFISTGRGVREKIVSSIEACSKIACTGCGACSAVCKSSAIIMSYDEYGFISPQIDGDKCLNCGQCKAVCFKYEDTYVKNLDLGKVYAAYSAKAEVRDSSSSGGAAYEISVWAIEHGYEVWGCAYDVQRKRATHKVAKTIEALSQFQGSKYIQSDTAELMEAVNKGLIADKAMIIGTPCQIYALRKLQSRYKKSQWLLIDIFCSGVPSYLLWDKYIKHISDDHGMGAELNVLFRDKSYSWHDLQMTITDEVGNEYTRPAKDDLFYTFFLSKMSSRDSCYDCVFKWKTTYADIRIGDFWGHKYSDNHRGVSMMITYDQNGERILNDLVAKGSVIIEGATFDDVLEAQHIINKKRTRKVDKIRDMLTTHDIDEVADKYLLPSKGFLLLRRMYQSLPEPIYNFTRRLRGVDMDNNKSSVQEVTDKKFGGGYLNSKMCSASILMEVAA